MANVPALQHIHIARAYDGRHATHAATRLPGGLLALRRALVAYCHPPATCVCVVSSHTIAEKRCTRKPAAPRAPAKRGKLNRAAHARGHALLHTRRCCSNIHCHITNYSASRRQRMVLTLRLRAASHTRAAARGGRRAPPLSTRACPQKSKTLILVANDLLSATSSSGRPLINRCQRGS